MRVRKRQMMISLLEQWGERRERENLRERKSYWMRAQREKLKIEKERENERETRERKTDGEKEQKGN